MYEIPETFGSLFHSFDNKDRYHGSMHRMFRLFVKSLRKQRSLLDYKIESNKGDRNAPGFVHGLFQLHECDVICEVVVGPFEQYKSQRFDKLVAVGQYQVVKDGQRITVHQKQLKMNYETIFSFVKSARHFELDNLSIGGAG
ncbi:MAG: hypothetical protein C9356_12085 [Oleiphilus sp.]|nr:MAG: hypothetical protein C9356_12085 [Oleiphilus sp.]